MKINFLYDEQKDIECLLSKGGGSNNQPDSKTKVYEALLAYTSDITNIDKVRKFVQNYIKETDLNPTENTQVIQNNWDIIADKFEKCAQDVFGVSMSETITAYLTITGRYPYNISGKYFFVSANNLNANAVVMHELWHFYTYSKFGNQIHEIGEEKFNALKESLTVLLNIVCAELMGKEKDVGYPQHQELRNIIVESWNKTKDIDVIWKDIVSYRIG